MVWDYEQFLAASVKYFLAACLASALKHAVAILASARTLPLLEYMAVRSEGRLQQAKLDAS